MTGAVSLSVISVIERLQVRIGSRSIGRAPGRIPASIVYISFLFITYDKKIGEAFLSLSDFFMLPDFTFIAAKLR